MDNNYIKAVRAKMKKRGNSDEDIEKEIASMQSDARTAPQMLKPQELTIDEIVAAIASIEQISESVVQILFTNGETRLLGFSRSVIALLQTVDAENAKPFCSQCDSKGVKHKKDCPLAKK